MPAAGVVAVRRARVLHQVLVDHRRRVGTITVVLRGGLTGQEVLYFSLMSEITQCHTISLVLLIDTYHKSTLWRRLSGCITESRQCIDARK